MMAQARVIESGQFSPFFIQLRPFNGYISCVVKSEIRISKCEYRNPKFHKQYKPQDVSQLLSVKPHTCNFEI